MGCRVVVQGGGCCCRDCWRGKPWGEKRYGQRGCFRETVRDIWREGAALKGGSSFSGGGKRRGRRYFDGEPLVRKRELKRVLALREGGS